MGGPMEAAARLVAQIRAGGRRDRQAAERANLAAILARATPPASASPMIVAAPARGPSLVVPQFERVIVKGRPVQIATTTSGFHPIRAADVFDTMRLQASKRRGGGATLTREQEEVGRDYAALVERVASAGVRGSSLAPTIRATGGGGGGYSEAIMLDIAHLRAVQLLIGGGVALVAVNARAHADRARVGVKVRYLVDQVCLGDWPLSRVLIRCGWSASSRNLAELRAVLASTLDRMGGLDLGDREGSGIAATEDELAVRRPNRAPTVAGGA